MGRGQGCGSDTAAQRQSHLMWSYFRKSVLYSTARCCSSTSRQLPKMDTTWRMRLGHMMVCEWNGSLPCPSTPRYGRGGKGPPEQWGTHDTWLKRKNLRIGRTGVRVWRETQKPVGTMKGHLSLETPRRGSLEGLGPFLTCCLHEAGC